MAKQKLKITWPVAIGLIYGVFVLILIGFVIFSSFNSVDLVSPDYYAQELKYQQHINRVERTQQQNKNIRISYDQASRLIELEFPAGFEPEDIQGKILFFRPSNANLDQTYEVHPDHERKQYLKTDHLASGLWRVKIFWKIKNLEYYNDSTIYID